MKGNKSPQRIKRGPCIVSICKTLSKGYSLYTLAHYDAEGQRCRRTFASYGEAHEVTVETASKLAAGKPDLPLPTGNDLIPHLGGLGGGSQPKRTWPDCLVDDME